MQLVEPMTTEARFFNRLLAIGRCAPLGKPMKETSIVSAFRKIILAYVVLTSHCRRKSLIKAIVCGRMKHIRFTAT